MRAYRIVRLSQALFDIFSSATFMRSQNRFLEEYNILDLRKEWLLITKESVTGNVLQTCLGNTLFGIIKYWITKRKRESKDRL